MTVLLLVFVRHFGNIGGPNDFDCCATPGDLRKLEAKQVRNIMLLAYLMGKCILSGRSVLSDLFRDTYYAASAKGGFPIFLALPYTLYPWLMMHCHPDHSVTKRHADEVLVIRSWDHLNPEEKEECGAIITRNLEEETKHVQISSAIVIHWKYYRDFLDFSDGSVEAFLDHYQDVLKLASGLEHNPFEAISDVSTDGFVATLTSANKPVSTMATDQLLDDLLISTLEREVQEKFCEACPFALLDDMIG